MKRLTDPGNAVKGLRFSLVRVIPLVDRYHLKRSHNRRLIEYFGNDDEDQQSALSVHIRNVCALIAPGCDSSPEMF